MSTSVRFTFANASGHQLAAIIDLPILPVKYYALYAHCFTCGKDILIAARIAKSLAAKGIAVMRFDFTGIGNSEGTFAESTFSNNTSDILSAADYLRENFQAPKLLIGHSLGGTALLNAAEDIPESNALVTIGSPASPEHVLGHFKPAVEALNNQANVDINIAGKQLTITQSFVDDFINQSLEEKINQLPKALLVFHSPVDNIVSISEATKIFVAAKHPKSFVSLDQADHLVSDKIDIEYIAETIIAWSSRYISTENK